MVGSKLNSLLLESQKYIGLPYFTNRGRHHRNSPENALVGKGSAKEIALKTIELANNQNIKLINLSPIEFYRFQKKNHLGIDCSGLACHLLNYYFQTNLNPRKCSANMLTSSPISQQIPLSEIKTGDLIRQKNGHHVLFVLSRNKDTVNYIDSSFRGGGVKTSSFVLSNPQIEINGVYRLISPRPRVDISGD